MKFNKLGFIGLMFAAFVVSSSSVYGAELNTYDRTAREIQAKTDAEFDAYIAEYVHNKEEKGISHDQIESDLAKVGVDLSFTDTDNAIQPLTISLPSDSKVSIYTTKRIGDSYYRIIAQVNWVYTPISTGSLDLLSVEWDYNSADFYNYTTDSNFSTLMDISQKSKGIVLFNVEDLRMYSGDYTYAGVYVTKKTGATQVEYNTKFVHTYDDKGITWSVGGNVGYNKDGPSGGMTFTITPTSATKSWTLSDWNLTSF
ncbi:hypothetical protein [Paenibacillus tengchongensis]|uniref:hypothetical protein n=1 Tax=Paenibacillus tengchongensis TaxID=2608684 RepID=UPI00124CF465|nr:hypothetical protein [Paenibacillus tengchongensis]